MKIETNTMTLSDYLEHEFTCDCGKTHSTKLEDVEIGKDALNALPHYLNKFHLKYPYVVCDAITHGIAGQRVMDILKANQFEAYEHVFHTKRFIPDEKAIGELLVDLVKCDVIIAIGTGSINDLVRFFSFKLDKPFITIATAAPMDGFASSVAALIINNFKTTYETQVPKLIIGDTEILKNAPISMITAGVGDILGKFTCLCDWKLSERINHESYCPTIGNMVYKSIQEVYAHAQKVKERDSHAIGKVMEALVLTGVAMSFAGNSRPAAGSEHHLSHYWEMLHAEQGLPPALHGAQVGVGTVIIIKIAELLAQIPVDFAGAREKARRYDETRWTEDIRRVYGLAAEGIIALEKESQKNNTEKVLKRLDVIEANWPEIKAILKDNLPPAEEIKSTLKNLDAPYLPAQIRVDDQALRNAVIYAKETRARYTILQLVWDLGLSEYMADQIAAYVQAEQEPNNAGLAAAR